MAKTSGTSWVWVLLIAAVIFFVFKRVSSSGSSLRYDDDSTVIVPRRQVLAEVPNGTPLRLADSMRLSVDDTFPRIGDATVSLVHDMTEGKQLAQLVVARLNANGAKSTLLIPEVMNFSKSMDSNKIVRYDLKFMIYDNKAAEPGYPAEQTVKLAATLLQAPGQSTKVFSLGFATPHKPIGGPDGFDVLNTDAHLARWQSPLEILRQMNFGPDSQVQT